MLPLSIHTLFGLRFDSSKTFWKALVIVIPFYLLKELHMHIYYIYLLIAYLLNLHPSAKSAPQILSIEDECTFLLLTFLIIGLYNSSANPLLEIFSLLILLSEDILSKKF